MRQEKAFTLIFLVILSIDIICKNFESLVPHRVITKPSVISSLLVFFYVKSKHFNKEDRAPILLALILMILGDLCFLQFDNFFFFTTGFILFLAANIMYLISFYTKVSYKINKIIPYWIIVIGVSLGLLILMYDGLGIFLVPVIMFMVIGFSMMQTTYLRYATTDRESFFMVFLGAVLFVTSECIVALNTFYHPVPYEEILTMLTYGLGNLFIIKGILLEHNQHVFIPSTRE